ncbi:hypothetical protein ACFX13_034204 [Malus domestica]
MLDKLQLTDRTPEAVFAQRLLSRLRKLKLNHHRYPHMDTFLGEILGAVILGSKQSQLNQIYEFKPLKVVEKEKFFSVLEIGRSIPSVIIQLVDIYFSSFQSFVCYT